MLLPDKIDNFIWIHTGFLGDLVLSSGAFKLLKQKFPRAKFHLITTGIGRAIFEDSGLFDSIFVIDKKKFLLSQVFKAGQYIKDQGITKTSSVLLQVHLSTRSSLLAFLLGIPRICYHQSSLSIFACRRVPRVAVMHESVRVALLLEPLGIGRDEIVLVKPWLPRFSVDNKEASSDGSATKKVKIGVFPGSKWGTKKWPASRMAEVIAKILDSDRSETISICLYGSPEDRVDGDIITRHLKRFDGNTVIKNKIGRTSLKELFNEVSQLDLLIGGDSACLHIASAYDVRTIAIFGATVPEMGFAPVASHRDIIEVKSVSCRPCSLHGPQKCPLGHFKCMLEIAVEDVYTRVQENIDQIAQLSV